MRHHSSWNFAAAFFIVVVSAALAAADAGPSATSSTGSAGKEVLIPSRVTRVPNDNDYDNPDSEFCHKRSKSSENFVLFWAKEYGDDPATNPVENRRFDVDAALKECERFYEYYTNTLKWVDKQKS